MRTSFVDALADAIVRQLISAASPSGVILASPDQRRTRTRRRQFSGRSAQASALIDQLLGGSVEGRSRRTVGMRARAAPSAFGGEFEQIASAIAERLSGGGQGDELPLETIEI